MYENNFSKLDNLCPTVTGRPELEPAELGIALDRVRDELITHPKTGRALVSNPFELELVEANRDVWLDDLAESLALGRWVPGPIEVCDVPKGKDLVRPGVRLAVVDRVVYTAAVGACLQQIQKTVQWSQGGCDFAVRLDPAGLSGSDWLRNPFKGWDEFRRRSAQRVDGHLLPYVLIADIAGFFENININLLISDLSRIECPSGAVRIIGECLNGWADTPGRGLPQGVMASDILAKLYMEPFDARLRNEGYSHLRYVDDLRVFTDSRSAAQRALRLVTGVLRKRGLTLQSAKTKICMAHDARAEFDGVAPVIKRLQEDYVNEALAAGLMENDVSLPMVAVDDLADLHPDVVPPEVIRRAYDTYIDNGRWFHPTLFRFLINRLGRRRDTYAVPGLEDLFSARPELTPSILQYLQRLGHADGYEPMLSRVLVSESSVVYPYVQYLILGWLDRNVSKLDGPTEYVVRDLAFEAGVPTFVQAAARVLIGRFGGHADLDRLVEIYRSSSGPLERAQALCSLKRLEKAQRNALIGRARRERSIVGWAAAWTREAS